MADSAQTILFPPTAGKEVVARFDGGDITSDSGVMLLAKADTKLGLTQAMAAEIVDERQAAKVVHRLQLLVQQRVYAIACGYEDANDFDTLAADPAFKLACGRAPKTGQDLGSQPTVSRLEKAVNSKDIYCTAYAIARCVVGQLPRKTKTVTLDIDAYDDPCHGQQQLEFFNAHYDSHCYLPLVVFVTGDDGVQRLMGALLRPGNAGSAGVRAVIRVAVAIVRERLPHVRIILRADAGFGNAMVLRLCDQLKISYSLGLASNRRLALLSTRTQMQACWRYTFAKDQWEQDGVCRLFGRFDYKAGSWKRKHNVVVKAEITQGSLNPRYVVTDLHKTSPERAYTFYCRRGDIENRIKEFKLDLAAGRTSCHRFLANQFRLLLHVAAAVLMSAIQQAAKGTQFESAQAATIRLRLLKLGARVVETTRRIWLHMSSAYPSQAAWGRVFAGLGP
jgi:DDE family transposase